MTSTARAKGGSYALILALGVETTIAVGKLATFTFPPGYYLYVGSALGGLAARIRRHLEGSPKLRWHIDYLRQKAKPAEVWYLLSGENMECSWYQEAASMPQAQTPVAGFGSSDCACRSHLVYSTQLPQFEVFRGKLGERGRDIRKVRPELSFMI